MNSPSDPVIRTAEEKAQLRYANCPSCKKKLLLLPQFDGFGRANHQKPHRYPLHAGNEFGRWCPQSEELEQ